MKRNYFIRRRIEPLAIFGLMLLLGTAFWSGASAAGFDNLHVSPLYERYLNDVRNGEGYKWTMIPDMYLPSAKEEGFGGADNLPASYNLIDEGYATQIKDQGSEGLCWAYAMTTAMESNLLMKYDTPEVFSPKQIDYLISPGTRYYDYIRGLFGVGYDHALGDGIASFGYASLALSSTSVPADESDFFAKMQENDPVLESYNSYGQFQNMNRVALTLEDYLGSSPSAYTTEMSDAAITGTKSEYYVDSYTQYYATATDVNDIKNDVYENGAVYVQTVAPGVYGCYDYTTNTIIDRGALICKDNEGNVSMHAMAIIGWDDNYTYTDPADGQQKQGAFLLQNSWGTDDLFTDYGITYEFLVASGAIDPSTLTSDEIADIKDIIANYDAYQFIHLAYNFEKSELKQPITGFASIGVEKNNYKYSFDVLDDVEGLGSSINDDSSAIIFTYDAGDTSKRIEAISVALHLIYSGGTTFPAIYVDDGDGWELYGTVTLPSDVSVRKTVKATKNIDVTGVYKVKLDFGGEIDGLDEVYELVTTTVYAGDTPNEPTNPDEPGEGDDDPKPDTPAIDDEDVDIKVPDTGLFTLLKSAYVVIPSLMVVFGLGYASYKVYINRKEIFHKVKFDKK